MRRADGLAETVDRLHTCGARRESVDSRDPVIDLVRSVEDGEAKGQHRQKKKLERGWFHSNAEGDYWVPSATVSCAEGRLIDFRTLPSDKAQRSRHAGQGNCIPAEVFYRLRKGGCWLRKHGLGRHNGNNEINDLWGLWVGMRQGKTEGWWPETGSNRRRRPFQGRALPLSYLALAFFRASAPIRQPRSPAGLVRLNFACL
jgi:hypothetical protein